MRLESEPFKICFNENVQNNFTIFTKICFDCSIRLQFNPSKRVIQTTTFFFIIHEYETKIIIQILPIQIEQK